MPVSAVLPQVEGKAGDLGADAGLQDVVSGSVDGVGGGWVDEASSHSGQDN